MRIVNFTDLFTLKTRDFLKSLILAIGTPILYFIQEAIPMYDISPLFKIALAAGITYLLKNFFTPVPDEIHIDPAKTSVVNENTDKVLVKSSNVRDDTVANPNRKT